MYFLFSLKIHLFTVKNIDVTLDKFLAFILTYAFINLTFAGAMSGVAKKISKKLSLSNGILSLVLAFILIFILNKDVGNYNWISGAFVLGYLIHLAGDTLTTAGAPLLFPIKIRGKRWYTIRLAHLKSGGEIEQKVVIPLFGVVTVLSIIFSILRFANIV